MKALNTLALTLMAFAMTTTAFAQVPGDVNGNGMRDAADLDFICTNIGATVCNGCPQENGDFNNNGVFDFSDIQDWRLYYGVVDLGGTQAVLPGDANLDGYVNGQDYIIIVVDNLFTSGTTWSSGDMNCDHQTNGLDFLIWNTFKFQDIYP